MYSWPSTIEPGTPFFAPSLELIAMPADSMDVPYWGRHHVPSITWCENGDMLATVFTAPRDKSDQKVILFMRLRQGADRWGPPARFFTTPDHNASSSCLYHGSDGVLYHYNGISKPGINQLYSMIRRTSRDNGVTWTSPQIVNRFPVNPADMETFTGKARLWPHMSLTDMGDGTLIMPSDVGGGHDRGTVLYESQDNGLSWTERTRFGWNHEEFALKGGEAGWIAGIHAPFVELKDGRYLAFGRTNDIDGKSPFSFSSDSGRTWTYYASPFPTLFSGQRPILKRLEEGPLLLVSFTDWAGNKTREGMEIINAEGKRERIYGIFAALSYDEGKTWPVIKPVPIHPDKPGKTEVWGYLAAVQTPDRMIHMINSERYYRFNLAWLEQPY